MFSDILWQDVVLFVGNIVFLIGIFPSIFSKDKPSKWTSLPTAIALTSFSFVYYSLSLTLSTVLVALCALGWWVLFFQKIK